MRRDLTFHLRDRISLSYRTYDFFFIQTTKKEAIAFEYNLVQ